MRILTLTLLALVAMVVLSLPASRPLNTLAPAASCAICDYINADQACTAQRLDRFYSCVLAYISSGTINEIVRTSTAEGTELFAYGDRSYFLSRASKLPRATLRS